MLTCGDDGTILECSFINIPDMKVVDASEVFEMGRQWKDEILVYDTVKKYAAKKVWKATIDSSYIKCPYYKKSEPNEKVNQNGGSIHKGHEWKVKIKATKVEINTITEVNNDGKKIQNPIFNDNVPVIVSKYQYKHTGTCNPSPQQQLVQRSRLGDY